jgi:hypothetical protein
MFTFVGIAILVAIVIAVVIQLSRNRSDMGQRQPMTNPSDADFPFLDASDTSMSSHHDASTHGHCDSGHDAGGFDCSHGGFDCSGHH